VNEFSLISQYFTECGQSAYSVDVDIGDDAAIVSMPALSQLVMTMDTLIENVHFPSATSASDIAHKALAVNLSDLAAMGATPAWFLLSISLPEANEQWLKEFSQTLCKQAKHYAIKLIGGDTCKGPLSITIQATGIVEGDALLRSAAQIGDHIFVSGALGYAALGLGLIQKTINGVPNEQKCLDALNRPVPRLDVAKLVKPYANAMIDLSDGLLADLNHVLKASQCGAELFLDQIPMPDYIKHTAKFHFALNGGDDYELCFTVPEQSLKKMHSVLHQHNIAVYDIGQITATELKLFKDSEREIMDKSHMTGFKHFG